MLDLIKGGDEGAEHENALNPEALGPLHQPFTLLRSADLTRTVLFSLPGLCQHRGQRYKGLIISMNLPAIWWGCLTKEKTKLAKTQIRIKSLGLVETSLPPESPPELVTSPTAWWCLCSSIDHTLFLHLPCFQIPPNTGLSIAQSRHWEGLWKETGWCWRLSRLWQEALAPGFRVTGVLVHFGPSQPCQFRISKCPGIHIGSSNPPPPFQVIFMHHYIWEQVDISV